MTAVPVSCSILDSSEIGITEEQDVRVILEKLHSGNWTALQVTTAYLKRAVIAHQLTNCLTEIFIERALKRARTLDEYLQRTGKPIGPLHGLPISLKDQFCIAGYETIMGYVSWVGRTADKNSVIVDLLEEAGAIPIARTNVPQTLMWGETYNHVFGRTTNPYNISLTCGGSSGGEGALISLKGSPLGVGTDIGGSVRIPSDFCGIYGLRPSYNRFPYQGAVNSMAGQESVTSVLGPMSGSLSGLVIFTKTVLDAQPWNYDPVVPRLPWNQDAYELVDHGRGSGLCFGILMHDEHTLPHPPIHRALNMVKEALERAGHRVIQWQPYKHVELYEAQWTIETADLAEDILTECRATGEPYITSLDPVNVDAELNAPVGCDPPQKPSPFHTEHLSAYQLWKTHERKRQLRKDYLDYWMRSALDTGTGRPIDALISPVAPFAAPPHGKNNHCNYTMLFNALDYPAIAFPVTTVDQEKDIIVERTSFYSDADKANHEMYDPQVFRDAPVGLQLVARTQEEEALLGMMEIVDEALRKRRMAA
ncbi:amidase [Serendipita vermifera]|nr:amidase [Serendipita vermifera]